MSTLKVNTIQNASGVEKYLCQAWVNFNGTGTVAIRASGNVSSITDNGTGRYTINFTTAMPDENYVTNISGKRGAGSLAEQGDTNIGMSFYSVATYIASSVQIAIGSPSAKEDSNLVSVAIFR